MGTVLTGGIVVTAVDHGPADVRLEGERIAAVGRNIRQPDDCAVDVSGCYLFPGGIDPHTHFDLPVGPTSTADDFASGTAAAAAGGTTTILDFATQNKGQSLMQALESWHNKAAGKCYTDYGFHLAVSEVTADVLAEMQAVVAAGVPSFKLYMAYRDVLQVDDGALLAAFQQAARLGALVCLHCENGDAIDALVKMALANGNTAPRFHALTRPAILEAEAVNRAICLAHLAGAPLYVVHVSSGEALTVIEQAQSKGWPVYAETCPQYLLLDESAYDGREAAKFVIAPPLRSADNQPLLWQGLKTGSLRTVASDHCSFNLRGQKDLGRADFSKIPNGAPGVENRFGLLYTAGVAGGRLSLQDFVAVISTNAAKLFGLYPDKGTIAPGSHADIVVWDPAAAQTISAANQIQKVDYNLYEGFTQAGAIRAVYLRGRKIAGGGRLAEGGPGGRFIKRRRT